MAIAKQQARRAQARRWWVRAPSRAWSFVLRWTIGYGYRPALALPYLAGLFVLGWVVFGHAYPTELRPAKSGPGQPGFNPARYTLDLLLPVANLHQRDAFHPHGYAAWWAFGLTLALAAGRGRGRRAHRRVQTGLETAATARVVSGSASDNGRLSGTSGRGAWART